MLFYVSDIFSYLNLPKTDQAKRPGFLFLEFKTVFKKWFLDFPFKFYLVNVSLES